MEIKKARDFYWSQLAIAALKASGREDFSWEIDDGLAGSLEGYVTSERAGAAVCYALVRNGQWFARGDMGWWGISTNEQDSCDQKINELIDGLPDDTLITIVDCHI
jgi:hypothetical protein